MPKISIYTIYTPKTKNCEPFVFRSAYKLKKWCVCHQQICTRQHLSWMNDDLVVLAACCCYMVEAHFKIFVCGVDVPYCSVYSLMRLDNVFHFSYTIFFIIIIVLLMPASRWLCVLVFSCWYRCKTNGYQQFSVFPDVPLRQTTNIAELTDVQRDWVEKLSESSPPVSTVSLGSTVFCSKYNENIWSSEKTYSCIFNSCIADSCAQNNNEFESITHRH